MRRLARMLLVTILLLGGTALYICYPWLSAAQVDSPLQAASMLETACEDGENRVVFREGEVNLDSAYDTLEAIYPFAFSLHSVTRFNRTTTLEVAGSRMERQQQAEVFAEQLAADTVNDAMTDAEKFRALHDALVRLCRYDSETAESAEIDGATAPFAADGALLDHKAVCAGYGRAYVMLCRAVGLQAIYVTSDQMNHGWNAVLLDGEARYVDCTFDDPVPDQGEYAQETYLLLTREEMEQTHEWDWAFYENILKTLAEYR